MKRCKYILVSLIILILLVVLLKPTKNKTKSIERLSSAELLNEYKNAYGTLLIDASKAGQKAFCKNYGYDYDDSSNSCKYNQATCFRDSNVEGTYLEWHNGKCIQTSPLVKKLLCDKNEVNYIQGNVTCDSNGVCTNDIGIGTCELTEPYCTAFGLDYNSDNNGDCYTNDAQKYAELILSTSLVRQAKASLNDPNALQGAGGLVALPLKMLVDPLAGVIADKMGATHVDVRDPVLNGLCMDPSQNLSWTGVRAFNNLYDPNDKGVYLDKSNQLYQDHLKNQDDNSVWDITQLSRESCLQYFSSRYGQELEPSFSNKPGYINWGRMKKYLYMQYCNNYGEKMCFPDDGGNKHLCCSFYNSCKCDTYNTTPGFKLWDLYPELFTVDFSKVNNPTCKTDIDDIFNTLKSMFTNVFFAQFQEYWNNTISVNGEPWRDTSHMFNLCFQFQKRSGTDSIDPISHLNSYIFDIALDQQCMASVSGRPETKFILSTFSNNQTFCGQNVSNMFQNTNYILIIKNDLINIAKGMEDVLRKGWLLTYVCRSGNNADVSFTYDLVIEDAGNNNSRMVFLYKPIFMNAGSFGTGLQSLCPAS